MPLETGTEIPDLNAAWPLGSDPQSQGDDHIRLVKTCVQGSLPNLVGPWDVDQQVKATGFDASDNVIANVAEPVADGDAATKNYVDLAVQTVVGVRSIGIVGNAGNISGGSGDFTVNKSGTGVYELTFNSAATSTVNQIVVANNLVISEPHICVMDAVSATRVDVRVYTRTGAAADIGFMFERVAI